MTPRQFHIRFEQELQELHSEVYDDLLPEEIDIRLNDSVSRFISNRFDDFNRSKRLEGFQKAQKRLDDLRRLIKSSTLTELNNTNDYKEFNLPEDYRHLIVDNSTVSIEGCEETRKAGNRLHELEEINGVLSNAFAKSKPLSPVSGIIGNKLRVYKDGFDIDSVEIYYIKKPDAIDISNPDTDWSELPDYACLEIVDNSVADTLEILQNQRYKSKSIHNVNNE